MKINADRRALVAFGLIAIACSNDVVPVGAYSEGAGGNSRSDAPDAIAGAGSADGVEPSSSSGARPAAAGDSTPVSGQTDEATALGADDAGEAAATSGAEDTEAVEDRSDTADAADGPGGAPPSNDAVLVGPDGAVLEEQGVRVTIPPDALGFEVEVSLTVDTDNQTLTVSPNLLLQAPARVELPWECGLGDAVVASDGDEDWTEIASIGSGGERPYYETDQLSQHQLRRREVVSGCWEKGWSHRAVASGEKCAGEPAAEATTCTSTFPSLVEDAASEPLSPAEITRSRLPGTQVESADDRLVDVREFAGLGWHADPIQTSFGACRVDADCRSSGYRASGECDEGICSFDREGFESYVLTFPAAATLAAAQEILKSELPQFEILITAALDTSGRFDSPMSLHYAGRAVDVSLWHVAEERAATRAELDEHLSRLAPMLLRAGFNWVWFESATHLHASIGTGETSCVLPLERCDCEAPVVAADPTNLTCDPTSGPDVCPACFPQHFACDTGLPPVEGCISNGLNEYCCPPLPVDFPCVPTEPMRVGTYSTDDGATRPSCEAWPLADGSPARYSWSCATASLPECAPASASARIYCDEEWNIANNLCCSRAN